MYNAFSASLPFFDINVVQRNNEMYVPEILIYVCIY